MIKIYNLSRGVFSDYIAETVRGKDTNEYALRLKLSAMIHATDNIIEREDFKIYKMGKFCILVRNRTPDFISLVYWTQERGYTSPETRTKLHEAYREVGLNEEGTKYIKIPTDEEVLADEEQRKDRKRKRE